MYDFDEEKMETGSVKRASILDGLIQKIYEDVIAREDVHIESVGLSDVSSFYLKGIEKYSQVEKMLVFYKEKGGKYELFQILLDKNDNEFRINNKRCIGKRLVANTLADSLVNWFDGSTRKIMDKTNLFK